MDRIYGAHVNIDRYDAIQEVGYSLSQNDVQICQISNGSEQSIPSGGDSGLTRTIAMPIQNKTPMVSSKH